jgi:hypothetical protein
LFEYRSRPTGWHQQSSFTIPLLSFIPAHQRFDGGENVAVYELGFALVHRYDSRLDAVENARVLFFNSHVYIACVLDAAVVSLTMLSRAGIQH